MRLLGSNDAGGVELFVKIVVHLCTEITGLVLLIVHHCLDNSTDGHLLIVVKC